VADLVTRAKNILMTPKTEWPAIASEHTDVATLYRSYIVPLSAIGPICRWIGWSVIGISAPFVGTFRVPFVTGLVGAIVSFVLGLVGIYVCAMVIEWLAPKFKSSGSRLDALKLVAYASTPVWIAGVLGLIPALGLLGILAAFYAIYLFYLGVPVLMKTPTDQVIPYMVVSAIVMIVLFVVVGAITGAIMNTMGGGIYPRVY
jgi:hypothetical protein